jgi:hypothetical protein
VSSESLGLAVLGALLTLMLAWGVAAARRYAAMVDFRETIRDRTDAFLVAQEAAGQLDYPPTWQPERIASRGIVICAGGRGLLAQAFTLIEVLRETHACELPVALFYVGREELPEACQTFFEARFENLVCIDAAALPVPPGHPSGTPLKGFAIKPCALLNAPFDEVLMLDADSVPLSDPNGLFEDPGYRAHGNLFWPDSFLMSTLVTHPAPNATRSFKDGRDPGAAQSVNPSLYDYLRLARPTTLERVCHETESGQILIDRRRCWRALQTCFFMTHWFRHFGLYMYGDKDLYRPAFGVAGLHFEQLSQVAHQAGRVEADVFDGLAMVQRDRAGEPAFLHQMHRKPSLDSPWIGLDHLARDKVADHPRPRTLRGVTMRVPISELDALEPLSPALCRVDEALMQAREALVAAGARAAFPEPKQKRLLRRRRLLPW